MTRRELLLLTACALPACRRSRREQTLRDLVERQIEPLYVRLAEASSRLAAAAAHVDASSLAAAQGHWRAAALLWREAYAFRLGPMMEQRALYRASYWPFEPARLQAALADGRPLDPARVEELGATAKGIFAVEHLLFDRRGGNPAVLAALGERPRQLLALLSADIAAQARAVTASLQRQEATFIELLARDPQGSLNRLVNDLIATVENVVTQRLGIVREAQQRGTVARNLIEGHESRSSRDLALAVLAGARQLYEAAPGGVGPLVARAAPAIDAAARAGFADAHAALAALAPALDEAAAQDPPAVTRAVDAAQRLERLLKADVASALGVTITFTSTDSD